MGICVDGLTILGVARSGADASPGNQFTLKTQTDFGALAFQAGDLAVILDMASNTIAALPTFITPAGWSATTNTSGNDDSGNGVRANLSYKILTAANIGATFTGMQGNLRHRKSVIMFRCTRPIQAVTVLDQNIVFAPGNPVGFGLTSTGFDIQNVLCIGLACAQNDMFAANFTWAPAAQGSPHLGDFDAIDGQAGSLETTRSTFSYWPVGYTNRVDHAIDLNSDFGDSNSIGGLVLGLT